MAVNRLKLDPDNPRLATSITRQPQKQLIEELIEHENVLDLARSIAQQGYFPNELLVAYKDGNDTIVVEGNRRLAALKVLLNPELAPAKYGKRTRAISDLARSPITKVPAIIAPSRDAAIPLILARHDGEAVKKWTPLMQARFVRSLIEQGLSLDDVVAQTGLEYSGVLRHFRNSKFSDVIQSLELPAEVREIVSNPRKFPFTTLERFIESSAVKNALSLETSDTEGFTTGLQREPFLAALTHIVTDIATGAVDSRSHNKADQVASYIKDMWASIGKKKTSDGRIPASAFIDPANPAKAKPPKKSAPKTRSPKPRNTLMPKRFQVDVDNHRIQSISAELKTLPLDRYPNAIAIMFRSLLEMALSSYLNEIGALKQIRDKMENSSKKKASARKPADWTPSFSQQLQWVADSNQVRIPPEARRAVRSFINEAKQNLTLDRMHAFTHNRFVPPSADQLRGYWENLNPLIVEILQNDDSK